MSKTTFQPLYAVPPGESLQETIDALGMTQAELATRMDRPKKTINEIIKGKAAITAETSLQLEKVTGVPASFWNQAEANYREALGRIAEREKWSEHRDWVKNFPYFAMAKRGWVPKTSDVASRVETLLKFFGIAHPEAFDETYQNLSVAYRKAVTFNSSSEALMAWLRYGEIQAQKLSSIPHFSKNQFEKTLTEIRALTKQGWNKAWPETVKLAANCGVICLFLPELPKTRVSGSVRKLDNGQILIQISNRHKKDGNFWFTFFHEAAHVLLHLDDNHLIIEPSELEDSVASIEVEANQWAGEFLISAQAIEHFLKAPRNGKYPSPAKVSQYAHQLGIAPGILVGRLQREQIIPYSYCNELAEKLDDTLIELTEN